MNSTQQMSNTIKTMNVQKKSQWNYRIPTISYLEVRDNQNTLLNNLYIGECDYETSKFTLNYYKNLETMPAENVMIDDYSNPNYSTIMSYKIWDALDIEDIQRTIPMFEPENMEEESALYDMKLVNYWVEDMREQHKNKQIRFIFITYYAILENLEYGPKYETSTMM